MSELNPPEWVRMIDGTWHHVAMVMRDDGQTERVFVDGVLFVRH
jgi:hypothetical protein